MAEKFRDAEDRLLESLLQSVPIADDGFSGRVVTKIRRRLWVRRLALPLAMVVGGAISIEPATQLLRALTKILTVVPADLFAVPAVWIPQFQIVVIGAMLLGAGVLGIRMLEE
jgi:hypothetical protein